MGQAVVAILNVQPVHTRLANRLGVLQRANPCEVVDEAVHHEVDLHPAQTGDIVVLVGDADLEFRRITDEGLAVRLAKLLFHLADEFGVLLEQAFVLGTDRARDALEVVADDVQHAQQAVAIA